MADDEKNICFLIENFLEKEGYEVECFGDGESLLEAFGKKAPDLCILDIMMPGMDGLTVCTQIRKTSHVPIIIVSAKDSPLDRITGITLPVRRPGNATGNVRASRFVSGIWDIR